MWRIDSTGRTSAVEAIMPLLLTYVQKQAGLRELCSLDRVADLGKGLTQIPWQHMGQCDPLLPISDKLGGNPVAY